LIIYEFDGFQIALASDGEELTLYQVAKVLAHSNGRVHNVRGRRVSDGAKVRVTTTLNRGPKKRDRPKKGEKFKTGVRIQLDPYS